MTSSSSISCPLVLYSDRWRVAHWKPRSWAICCRRHHCKAWDQAGGSRCTFDRWASSCTSAWPRILADPMRTICTQDTSARRFFALYETSMRARSSRSVGALCLRPRLNDTRSTPSERERQPLNATAKCAQKRPQIWPQAMHAVSKHGASGMAPRPPVILGSTLIW